MTYLIIFIVLLVIELGYFRVADKFNIIDKPNERSSHKMIVLRGGGVIFTIALWIWSIVYGFQYPWLLAGVTLAAGVSFIDDIHSLPDSPRLVVQFVSMTMVLFAVLPLADSGVAPIDVIKDHCANELAKPTISGLLEPVLFLIILIVAVSGTNFYNFMDGINGITGGYSLAMLFPLLLMNRKLGFMDESMLVVIGLSVVVFCIFNFRKKAKCFAGDVGSIGIALILTFGMGRLIYTTGDITWLIFFLLYGVDGILTLFHRMMLHENLGKPHRKHAFQLMSNELKMAHTVVSLIYTLVQLAVSLTMIYLVPDTVLAHWVYFVTMCVIFVAAYILFMWKYYHLHEEYLESLKELSKND